MKFPSHVGKYRLERRLGQGGMGTVFLAQDVKINRLVALKFLRVDNDDMRARFEREAQSAGRLQHPHIVTLFDYAEDDGTPYLVMEFVEGRTLSEVLKSGCDATLPTRLAWISQSLRALDYAHRCGVIHRDIKPSNLMLTAKGDIKILDFGIARNTDTRSTKSSRIVGTTSYMAPEQIRTEPIDGRCDVFAMGAVLQEVLTGEPAFDGETDYSIMDRILRGEPASFEHPEPGVTELMRPIIAKALQKNREDRYHDATEFAIAIEHAVTQLKSISPSALRTASTVMVARGRDTVGGPQVMTPMPAELAAVVAAATDNEVSEAASPAEVVVPPCPPALPLTSDETTIPAQQSAAKPVAAVSTGVPGSAPRTPPHRRRVTLTSGKTIDLPLRDFLAEPPVMVPSTFRQLIGASATLHTLAAVVLAMIVVANTGLPATREITRLYLAPPAVIPPSPAPPAIRRRPEPRPAARPAELVMSSPEPLKTEALTTPLEPTPAAPPSPEPPPVAPAPAPLQATGVDEKAVAATAGEVFGSEPVDNVNIPARVIEEPLPEFPTEALRRKIQFAQVTVEVVVTREGAVVSPKIVSGVDLFNEAALAAAVKYRFRPARLRGQAVATRVQLVIRFDLR